MTSQVKPAGSFPVHAAALSSAFISPADCLANANSPSCGMNGFLYLLYVLAAILGLLLLIAIAIAIFIWRRNRRTEITRP